MVEVKEEYAEKPVPQNARLGFLKPAMVWAGFAHAVHLHLYWKSNNGWFRCTDRICRYYIWTNIFVRIFRLNRTQRC